MNNITLAVIIGNRDFFPDKLVTEARKDILAVFKENDIQSVIVGEDETKLGSIETYEEAKTCAGLFKAHRDNIDGILIVLPNFGDERAVADTIKLSGLNVPILVQAYPDKLDALDVANRRDSFCGKISVCNNLNQYGFPFTLTKNHTIKPTSEGFKDDLKKFAGVCRVVKGLRNARLGAIGARPNAFNTVRYSEKLLQASGITVSTIDLSKILYKAQKIADNDSRVKEKLDEINAYARHDGVPSQSLTLMAKLGIVISDWMSENDIQATAFLCWDSIQQNYGVNPCTIMSIMSEQQMPSACEVDIAGAASMYALQLASGQPSALADWNNNYEDDPDRCVLFHCGNWAKSFVKDLKIATAPILGTTLGEKNTYGAMAGSASAGPITFGRISTNDKSGIISTYIGEGQITDDPLDTFGQRAVVKIPELQKLMRFICKSGFEHHVAMTKGKVADVLEEAFGNYMGWQIYRHNG